MRDIGATVDAGLAVDLPKWKQLSAKCHSQDLSVQDRHPTCRKINRSDRSCRGKRCIWLISKGPNTWWLLGCTCPGQPIVCRIKFVQNAVVCLYRRAPLKKMKVQMLPQ